MTTWLAAAVLSVAYAGAIHAAHAARISINGHGVGQVRASCGGGTSWNNTATGEYGCMAGNGSGIVCGGSAKGANKTCDTWGPGVKVAPKSSREQILQTATQAQHAK